MRIPTRADVAAAVGSLLPSSSRPFPIQDPAPDPGIFGPGSVTWRVMAEPLLMLGAGRALLMQAAQPLVAEGAIEHSTYATDPFGRFERTVEWVTVVCFGTTAEARTATRHVNRLHRSVEGVLSSGHATDGVRAGAPYSGRDTELLRWVLATFIDTMLVAHDAFVGGLTEDDRDRFVREWQAVGDLMGVSAGTAWRTRVELTEYVAETVASGRAMPGPGSRLVSRTILHPPVTSTAMRPLWATLSFTTTGLVPEPVRRAYGIRWTPLHAAAHSALALSLRTGRAALPRRLKVSPVYDRALARSEGRLTAGEGAA
jgi:uncharacterized protein (DUF2236 family)